MSFILIFLSATDISNCAFFSKYLRNLVYKFITNVTDSVESINKKVNVKLTLEQIMKDQRMSRCIALLLESQR